MTTSPCSAPPGLAGRLDAVVRPPAPGSEPGDTTSHAGVTAGEEIVRSWATFRRWEFLFGVTLPAAVVYVATDDDSPPWLRAAAVALMALGAVAYVLVGRRAIIEDVENSRRALLYWAVVAVTFVPAFVAVPAATLGLFALCPQAFIMLRVRWAVVAVTVLNLTPAVRFLATPRHTLSDVLTFTGWTAVTLTATLVFALWITRVVAQSAERARLIRELEASRAETARLYAERGALAERERLAGEIHDTLAQGFTSVIMLIQAAETQVGPSRHLDLAVRTARENLAEARALITALSPAPLDGSTLEEALRRVTERLGEELGIEARFTAEGVSLPLPPNIEVVLIRATQEGLANVRKHACARSVAVSIEYGAADVRLRVQDDGAGFDVADGQGYGLRAMRTRVEQQGGAFVVHSSPSEGTALTVTLPATA